MQQRGRCKVLHMPEGPATFHLTPSVPEVFSYTQLPAAPTLLKCFQTPGQGQPAQLFGFGHHITKQEKNMKEFFFSRTQAVLLACLWRPPGPVRTQDWAAAGTVAKQSNALTKWPRVFRQEKPISTQASITQKGYLTRARYMILFPSSRQTSDTSCYQRWRSCLAGPANIPAHGERLCWLISYSGRQANPPWSRGHKAAQF